MDEWPKIYYLELLRASDVKPLVPAEFAVVSTYQSALGPRGYGPIFLCVIIRKACDPAAEACIGFQNW
jgi:hypothetical protein